jgi:hypothetical protein
MITGAKGPQHVGRIYPLGASAVQYYGNGFIQNFGQSDKALTD